MKYFGKRKHAELFMDGKIHMKRLGYFWNILNCFMQNNIIYMKALFLPQINSNLTVF